MKFFKRKSSLPGSDISDSEQRKRIAAYSTLGLMFPVSIAIGLLIGILLDNLFDTSPVLTLIGILYGIGAGFYNFFKIVNKYEKKK